MHDYLLKVPNLLFYDDKIKSGYKKNPKMPFVIDEKKPMLFIDCETVELKYGTSFSN
jgi:hypothetical protein